MGAGPREILRTSEEAYKTHVAGRDLSDDALVDLMVQYPDLVQRPILEVDGRAVLGRPTERMAELLEEVMGPDPGQGYVDSGRPDE